MADTRNGQQAIPGQRDDVLVTIGWDPPYPSLDSLVITRRGLVPVTEHLDFRGSFNYHYDRNHVAGTVQPHDSAQRAYDQSFPSNVFAFNEMELLVRSLPFKQGLSVVAPLFSEVDRDLEMDTLTVLGPDTSSAGYGGKGWTVRFADPAIVARFVIDRTSRAIMSTEIFPRKTENADAVRPFVAANWGNAPGLVSLAPRTTVLSAAADCLAPFVDIGNLLLYYSNYLLM